MKTLHLRRHSIKDGTVKDTIGPKGFELARREGMRAIDANTTYNKVFHGPLLRTAQTALAFTERMFRSQGTMPVVTGLGDADLFAVMVNDEFKKNVAAGQSNFDALINAHPMDQVKAWASEARQAVQAMFDQMADGDVAIGFFHSPTIELAAWAALNYDSNFNPSFTRLSDLEGLTFVQRLGTNNFIDVVAKISIDPAEAQA